METDTQDTQETQDMPAALPLRPEDCRSLKQWIELGIGLPQAQIAHLAQTSQGRISLIVNGSMPRRKHWPALLRAFRLEGKEPLFYRWVREAHALALQKAALQRAAADDAPLFSTNVYAPAGRIVMAAGLDVERRAQA